MIGYVCLKGLLLVASYKDVDALMGRGALIYSCPLNLKILRTFLGKLKQCIFESTFLFFFLFFHMLVKHEWESNVLRTTTKNIMN